MMKKIYLCILQEKIIKKIEVTNIRRKMTVLLKFYLNITSRPCGSAAEICCPGKIPSTSLRESSIEARSFESQLNPLQSSLIVRTATPGVLPANSRAPIADRGLAPLNAMNILLPTMSATSGFGSLLKDVDIDCVDTTVLDWRSTKLTSLLTRMLVTANNLPS